MRVTVLYFGVLKDVMGHRSVVMDMAEGASVAELLALHRGSGAASVWESIAVAVNQEYARAVDVLQDGDEVALLPPVSGGCGAQATARTRTNAGVLRSAQNDKILGAMTRFCVRFEL
jgi:molybdopterin converting factor subunit 1